jgi:hypothetical protein
MHAAIFITHTLSKKYLVCQCNLRGLSDTPQPLYGRQREPLMFPS